jgi:hypothetical protein
MKIRLLLFLGYALFVVQEAVPNQGKIEAIEVRDKYPSDQEDRNIQYVEDIDPYELLPYWGWIIGCGWWAGDC